MEYSELVEASRPEALRAALAEHADALREAAHAHAQGIVSVRTATHKGHEIIVRTTYEITIDGRPFEVHLTVDNSGRVHYHGLPTRDFVSTIDLVKKVIDAFPDDFVAPTHSPDPTHPSGPHDHSDQPSR